MHVLILHNATVLTEEDPNFYSDYQVVDTAAAVEQSLRRAGHRVDCLALDRNLVSLRTAVARQAPDVVFNLFEGLADDPRTEWRVAAILEGLGVAFTGCPSKTLRSGGIKHLAKRLFQRSDVPTPRFQVVRRLPLARWHLGWPAIVKPGLCDASLGISQDSVVCNDNELARQVELTMRRFGPPVIVEEFVFGRELTVTLLELEHLVCLPCREILFPGNQEERWPILSYEAKWVPGTREYEATPVSYPAELDAVLAARIQYLSKRAFRVFHCRDCARVDFRVSATGEVSLLEINPNPDLSPNGALYLSTAAGHVGYDDLVLTMVHNAAARRAREAVAQPSSNGAFYGG